MTVEAGLKAPTLASRALGAVIMLKVSLPVIVLLVFVFGVWQIVTGVNHAIDRGWAVIEPRIADAQKQIDAIRDEGQRLVAEVKKVKNTTTEIAGAIKESVEPIRKSLLGLSSAMRTLSRSIESVLNALIKVLRKVPGLSKIKLVDLPDFEIKGLRLPNIDLDVDFIPSPAALQAIDALNDHAQQVAAQAERSLDEITETVLLWWWTAKAVGAMILLWLALSLVGLVARGVQRFASGWQMVRGRRVEGALGLL
jgi:uncharacterized protein YoxC